MPQRREHLRAAEGREIARLAERRVGEGGQQPVDVGFDRDAQDDRAVRDARLGEREAKRGLAEARWPVRRRRSGGGVVATRIAGEGPAGARPFRYG